jgi:hypothetical protein
MPQDLTKKKSGNMPITMMVPLEMKFSEEDTSEIQLLKMGEWNHPMYGPIKVTSDVFDEFIKNFKKDLRAHSSIIGLPVDEEHHSAGGAVGWIKKLINKGSEGLFATVEWNSKGRQMIKDAVYRFFSPEFYFQYEDPESRKVYNNVLVGGALTNRPYFKGLNPVVLSEDIIINNKNNNNMLLSEIIKKNLADLSDDEKSFVTSHFAELDEETKKKFNDVKPAETAEEKKAREDKELKAREDANKAEEEKNKTEKSVTMSEGEVLELKDQAQKGVQAMSEIKKMKLSDKIKSLTYSETNKGGKLPATLSEKITNFVMTLSEDQEKSFFEIVGDLPSAKLFTELGESALAGNDAGIAPKGVDQESFELDAKAKELMKANDKLTYDQALVMAEKELAKK